MTEQSASTAATGDADKKPRIGVVCASGRNHGNASLISSLSNSGYEVEILDSSREQSLFDKNPMAGYGGQDDFKHLAKNARKKDRKNRMKEMQLEAFSSKK